MVVTLAPVCLFSSATITHLSSALSLGVDKACVSLVSLAKALHRLLTAMAVGSRADVLAAAVY